MEANDDQEKLPRSAAMRSAHSILVNCQKAEQELVQAKEALEKKTEELANSLSLMRATLESTTDGILATDGNGTISTYNENFVEMWRMPREIVESRGGQRVLEFASRQFKAPREFLTRVYDIYTESPPETYDLLELADGRVFERYSKLQVIDERSVGRVWSFRNITDWKRAEEQVRASAERFQQLWSTTTDAIILMDVEQNVKFANPAVLQLFGFTPEEVCAQGLIIVIPERLREAHRRGLQRYLTTGVRKLDWRTTETTGLHRDGYEFPIEISFSHFLEDGCDRFAAFIRDITERKSAQEILKAAKVAAEDANKAKDGFLAVLSHELRTPLTPALAGANYLAEHERLPSEFREVVSAIRRNVELEARLIDDLLDLTQITRGTITLHQEAIDVHRVLIETLWIVHVEVIQKKIEIVRDLGARAHFVWADPVRIQQVFWNLISNALKFTGNEGRISLQTSNADGRFVFEISDSGVGIEPEEQGRIFKAFEQGERTVTRQFGGLGLGLTISKTLLDLHGGTISVQSRGRNQGATFRVTLSALEDAELMVDEPGQSSSAPVKGLRVLVVDDHSDTLRILSELLRKRGHVVLTAESVSGALDVLKTERFDALISDIGLPDGSGCEIMREAKDRYTLRGVAVSGFGMDEDIRRSIEAGFEHHFTKPIDFQAVDKFLGEVSRYRA